MSPRLSTGGTGKGARGKATKLHSQLVRSRGFCENCGSVEFLQCAHIVSRRYGATRTDENNAFCLCAKCHFRFTDHPDEWMAFVDKKIGRDEFDRLKQKALAGTGTKVDWAAEVARLTPLVANAVELA